MVGVHKAEVLSPLHGTSRTLLQPLERGAIDGPARAVAEDGAYVAGADGATEALVGPDEPLRHFVEARAVEIGRAHV